MALTEESTAIFSNHRYQLLGTLNGVPVQQRYRTQRSSIEIDVLVNIGFPSGNHLPCVSFVKPSDKLSARFVKDSLYGTSLSTPFAGRKLRRILRISFRFFTYLDRRVRIQLKPRVRTPNQ